MSSYDSIYAVLANIRRKLLERPVFLTGYGKMIDDPEASREIEELNKMKTGLALVLHNLRNRAELLKVREKSLWSVPLDQRWRAKSSLRDQNEDLQRALDEALVLERLLEELMRKNGMLTAGDMANAITEQVKKFYEYSHSGALVGEHGSGLAYLPAAQQRFQGSPEAVFIFVFAALSAFTEFMRRRQEGSR